MGVHGAELRHFSQAERGAQRQGRGWPAGKEFWSEVSAAKERMPLATRAGDGGQPLRAELEILPGKSPSSGGLHAESLAMGQNQRTLSARGRHPLATVSGIEGPQNHSIPTGRAPRPCTQGLRHPSPRSHRCLQGWC